MDHLFQVLLHLLIAALGLFSAGHALLTKRDPRSALGWITISLTLPLIGPFFYWSLGVNRLRHRARRWHAEGRRLQGGRFPAEPRPPEPLDVAPAGEGHLTELRRLADRIVSTPLTAGNSISPLEDGEEAYPAMLAAIEEATRSVNLSTYIFDGDAVGRDFVDALSRASERGVEVRVIVDGLGEKYSWPHARRLFGKASLVKVRRFLPLRHGIYINLRNHRKLLIVDGKRAFTGGMNIGRRHLVKREAPPPVVKDLHFVVTGPVVAELQRAFVDDWYFVAGETLAGSEFFPPLPATGTARARAIGDGPDREPSKLQWIIMGALSCARERVGIVTPYFIPDRSLISALVTASLRGVKVSIILPETNNLPFVHWASRAYLWELLQHDIRIFYQPPPFVHTKMFLVDGLWSLVGSANLDPRSLRLNFELDLEVYDEGVNALLEGRFAATLAVSRQVTLAEVDGRSLPEKLRDAAAKLFSPYL